MYQPIGSIHIQIRYYCYKCTKILLNNLSRSFVSLSILNMKWLINLLWFFKYTIYVCVFIYLQTDSSIVVGLKNLKPLLVPFSDNPVLKTFLYLFRQIENLPLKYLIYEIESWVKIYSLGPTIRWHKVYNIILKIIWTLNF